MRRVPFDQVPVGGFFHLEFLGRGPSDSVWKKVRDTDGWSAIICVSPRLGDEIIRWNEPVFLLEDGR